MRLHRYEEDDASVPISPLIDCVFLLLIFFLVTTMFKKFEKQIPVTLPDATSSLRAEANDEAEIVGLDELGNASRYTGNADQYGKKEFAPVVDLAVYLKSIADSRGTQTRIRLTADRMTPFQKVVDALDLAELQGFEDVEVRTRQALE